MSSIKKIYGLIGKKLGHSFSRDFFNKNELSFRFVIVYNRNWDNKESIEEIGDD